MRIMLAVFACFALVAIEGDDSHAFAGRRVGVKSIHVAAAIMENDIKALRKLLRESPALVNTLTECHDAKDSCSSSYSLNSDDERVCRRYCANGYAPDERCEGCQTLPVLSPLTIALRMNNLAAAKLLIVWGARIDKEIRDDIEAVRFSKYYPSLIEARSPEAAILLLKEKASWNFCTSYALDGSYTSRGESIFKMIPGWGQCPDSPEREFCLLADESTCYKPKPVRKVLEGRVAENPGWQAVLDLIPESSSK